MPYTVNVSAGLVLAHGAGSNRNAPLLVAVDRALSPAGWIVERIDLAFRLSRPHGPPRPADAKADQNRLREAIAALRAAGAAPVFAGGHSYGGRQATMLAAEDESLVSALLVLCYPLHPPRRPEQSRTAHLRNLRVPTLFVHGSRDPFGSLEEMRAALELIPGRVRLLEFEGAGHELGGKSREGLAAIAERIAQGFVDFCGQ
ncbi:MAG TPA: alpha/beta fold hydrolase [Bryobacteraceae bacterium]|jgi:predicted alpha/beta-hydrolase family hydrolase|nr:alpha/beta fold hydrolase [Bryobacteraceae bacterium]